MKNLTFASRFATLALVAAFAGGTAFAQGYYDDDIYYDASKTKKEKAVKSTSKNTATQAKSQAGNAVQYYYDGAQYEPWDNVGNYQAADTYTVNGTSTRDVDEYNRRYTVAPSKEQCDSITLEQFEEMSNTRNLARFHNSAEAKEAYAANAAESAYYDDYGAPAQSQTVINLNVVDPFYSSPFYSYPYYAYPRPWYWNSWGYYDPFWGPSWSYGPSWSWNWGWGGPSWSWGWGGPAWGPAWGPGWSHPRPNYTSAGAFAPNMVHRNQAGHAYRNNSTGRFTNGTRSSAAGSLGTRPGYGNSSTSGNRGNGSAVTNRPGYRAPTTNPNTNSTGTSVGRGRTPNGASYGTNSNTQNSTPRRNNNSYNQNNNSNSNRNNYNFNSGSRGRSGSSSGSFGGSRGGGFSGGGSRGGAGGGGHRGR